MKFSPRNLFLAASAVATVGGAAAVAPPAGATNLLVDPGFNTGANGFAGWTVSGSTPLALNIQLPYPGKLGEYFAPLPSDVPLGYKYALEESFGGNSISQTVAVSPSDVGKPLTLSVIFEDVGTDPATGPNASSLTLDLDGNTASFTPVPNTLSYSSQYEILSVTTTAQANNVVTISGKEPTNYYSFASPDLELGGVPEPTTWALMLLGFGGLGAAKRYDRAHKRALGANAL